MYSNLLDCFAKKIQFLNETSFLKKDILQSTTEAIIIENIYQNLPDNNNLKSHCFSLRAKRWRKNFGVPTTDFFLSYSQFFEKKLEPEIDLIFSQHFFEHFIKDDTNEILYNPAAIFSIPLPQDNNNFISTYNLVGGYTTNYLDEFSQMFVNYSKQCAENNFPVMDIAAGFGIATLSALKNGAKVFCNDIEPKNLSVIYQKYNCTQPQNGKLHLFNAKFPEEFTEIENGSIGAILICRLLHFFKGEKIIQALTIAKKLLTPGGKLFIVAETPYLKNWELFIPEYEQRCQEKILWPGEIQDSAKYETDGYKDKLPQFMHLLDKQVLIAALTKVGFSIEKSEYIDRRGTFPEQLTLSGKESIGIIGVNLV